MLLCNIELVRRKIAPLLYLYACQCNWEDGMKISALLMVAGAVIELVCMTAIAAIAGQCLVGRVKRACGDVPRVASPHRRSHINCDKLRQT